MQSSSEMTFIIVYIITTVLSAIVLANRSYIVGGFDAKRDSVPWTCSIRNKRTDRPFGAGHWCGGTLINSTTIVTATHCFMNHKYRVLTVFSWHPLIVFLIYSVQTKYAGQLLVVGGSLNRFNPKEASYIGRVRRLILNREYEYHNFANDIAILIVRSINNFKNFREEDCLK